MLRNRAVALRSDSPLVNQHRQAHRRLSLQTLLGRLTICLIVACALGVLWLLVQPWIATGAYKSNNIIVFFCLGVAALVAGVIWAIRIAPTRATTALEIDRRFGLCERVTTAYQLTEQERSSPAGQALLADVNQRLTGLRMRLRFPVRLGWPAWFLPVEILALLLIVLFYHPEIEAQGHGRDRAASREPALTTQGAGEDRSVQPWEPRVAERPGKAPKLQALEEELQRLLDQANRSDLPPEAWREELREAVELEDQIEEFAQNQAEKFAALQERMETFDRLAEQESFEPGPVQELHDALAERDLPEAREQVEQLQQQIEENAPSSEKSQHLQEQLRELQQRLEQTANENEQRQQELEELIQQAQSEGRDSEPLERERNEIQQQQEQSRDLDQMAERLRSAQESLEANQPQQAAEQLQQMAEQLQQLQNQLQDLQEAEQDLRQARDLQQQLRQRGTDQGEADRPRPERGDGDNREQVGDGLGEGHGEGARPDNPETVLGPEDIREEGQLNPWGRKVYGGATPGEGFTQRSGVEMQAEIERAAQTLPQAIEVQTLRRGEREMVREYFERLGDQE